MAIAVSATLFAQSEEKSKKITVPTNVKEAFTKDFPGKKVKWEKEGDNFEAEFKVKGSDASAVYDKKGYRKEIEITIKTVELPNEALQYVNKNYPKSKIMEAAKITNDKNLVTYEAEVKKEGKTYEILFNDNGKFIKIVDED